MDEFRSQSPVRKIASPKMIRGLSITKRKPNMDADSELSSP